MSFINYNAKEIHCKVVYYGPSLGGKTTNLQWVYQKTATDQKSKLIALNTDVERTLFFDFLPLNVGEIRGFKTRFHLFTVPGQVVYDASRKLILKGLDGVIHVEVKKMMSGSTPPQFVTLLDEDKRLQLEYRSDRGLCALAHGLMIGLNKKFEKLKWSGILLVIQFGFVLLTMLLITSNK